MLWQIDPTAPEALRNQIAANIRRAVSDGTLDGGERLPPAREVAVALDVNPNTVLHAYRSLRAEGLLEFRRGRGVRVCTNTAGLASVGDAVRDLLTVGRRHGFTREELARLVAEL